VTVTTPLAGALRGLLLGIDHVGIAVPDLDAAITFHREVFGMTLTHREENVEQGVSEAMLSVGTDTIQLLAPLTPESPIAAFIDKRGPGLQQLAYRVSDVRAASAALRERGLRLLYDEPRRGTAGSLINFIHPGSAGGVLIELVEHPQGR
jgi:methylmalonyl-CoA/ethylmalonyl-CoA epimerase